MSYSYENLLARAAQENNNYTLGDLSNTLDSVTIDSDVIAVARSSWRPQNKQKLVDALNSRNVILDIAPEKGLDSQGYKCETCKRPIGVIFGIPMVCWYSGKSYCAECFGNDERIIPGRILQNWDFKLRPVSKESGKTIDEIVSIPILHLAALSPGLHEHVAELSLIRKLRFQLTSVHSYLSICANAPKSWERATARFREKRYILEHTDIYSLEDLLSINMGTLAPDLRACVSEGIQHICKCDLCKLKGHICEMCGDRGVIYPFQIERIFKCPSCGTVYHKTCQPAAMHCPKCNRIKNRKQHIIETDTGIN